MLNRIFNLIEKAVKTFVAIINIFDNNYIFTYFILINYNHKYTLYT